MSQGQSQFYGVLEGVEVIPPATALLEVHNAYVAMASSGVATEQHREVFMRVGNELTQELGCESILLAGTDLALVFNNDSDVGFNFFECAAVHASAIAHLAMQPTSASFG